MPSSLLGRERIVCKQDGRGERQADMEGIEIARGGWRTGNRAPVAGGGIGTTDADGINAIGFHLKFEEGSKIVSRVAGFWGIVVVLKQVACCVEKKNFCIEVIVVDVKNDPLAPPGCKVEVVESAVAGCGNRRMGRSRRNIRTPAILNGGVEAGIEIAVVDRLRRCKGVVRLDFHEGLDERLDARNVEQVLVAGVDGVAGNPAEIALGVEFASLGVEFADADDIGTVSGG